MVRKLWRILPGILLVVAVGGVAFGQEAVEVEAEVETEVVPCERPCDEMMGKKMIRKYITAGDMSELEMTGLMDLKCLKGLKGLEGLEVLEGLEGLEGLGMLMQSDLCCPMVMHSPKAVDHYLCHKDAIGLSEEQVKSLKSIKDSHQREIIQKKADLQLAKLDLDNLLEEAEINLSKAESLTKKIGSLQAEIRFKGIEAAVKGKRILTEEQREKLENPGEGLLGEKRCRRIIIE